MLGDFLVERSPRLCRAPAVGIPSRCASLRRPLTCGLERSAIYCAAHDRLRLHCQPLSLHQRVTLLSDYPGTNSCRRRSSKRPLPSQNSWARVLLSGSYTKLSLPRQLSKLFSRTRTHSLDTLARHAELKKQASRPSKLDEKSKSILCRSAIAPLSDRTNLKTCPLARCLT